MSIFAHHVEAIKAHAEEVGLRNLARQSGVPYSTLRSLSERGWTSKTLDALDKLAAVAAPSGS